ncbi:nSTAND1 domain-containing NTPase [Streptomyces sp. NPDC002172]
MPGRRESPLDPSDGPVTRFAAELRRLRARAGSPTYRAMAQRTGQGASTLSQAAAGERLPTLPVVLAYVQACGGDPDEWEARWRQAAAEVAAEPRTDDENNEPPYRGLARFEPGDAELFFGRDELADRLLELTRARRFTAVFGSSGSGKSSLLRAGLIPRLRTPDPTGPQPVALRVLTPGEHPLRTHEQRLIPKDADGETWLIVDQFEELYTLCADQGERNEFIDCLLTAGDPTSRLRVVIAVRADFLGRCAEHPGLTAALQDGTVLAGPMSRDELREAIVKPAQSRGTIVERALTTRILDEVDGEPGALPMMSHALRETWRRRKGRALTVETYEAAGGLHGAIARTAEDLYTALTAAQADLARRIMLRLITPGDGTADTRRPTPRAELELGDPNDAITVLERLTRARLLTLDDGAVDLAHEALITAWPRLRGWIDAGRDRLRLHRQLTAAATGWDDVGRDSGALYRGTRLAAAEEAFPAADHSRYLTELEHAFLAASVDARLRDQRAAARTTRRLQSLIAALSVLALIAVGAAVTAFQQRTTAHKQRDTAVSRQITVEADQLRGTEVPPESQDVSLAAQLDITAYRLRRSPQTYTRLISAATTPLSSTVRGAGAAVYEVGYSPDGQVLGSVGSDDRIRLWDARDPAHLQRVGRALPGTTMAFSLRGHLLATAAQGDTNAAWLWDVTDPARPRLLGSPFDTARGVGTVALTFSPDGHALATATDDDMVRLWDIRDPARPRMMGRPLPGTIVAFSPRGHLLAAADDDFTLRLWDTRHPDRPRRVGHRFSSDAVSIAFSPDGGTLATVSDTDKVALWNVRNPSNAHRIDTPLSDDATSTDAMFSPDGKILALAQEDAVRLWNITDPADPVLLVRPLGHSRQKAFSMALDPDGRHLVVGNGDKLQIWTLPFTKLTDYSGSSDVVFSPDGQVLITQGEDYNPRLWDMRDPTDPRRANNAAMVSQGHSEALAFSPAGPVLATATEDGTLRLWDVTAPLTPAPLTASLLAPTGIATLAFSSDGHTLAAVTGNLDDGAGYPVHLWDLHDLAHPRRLPGFPSTPSDGIIDHLAFSPHGHMLAVASDTGRASLWDLGDPAHPRRIGRSFEGDSPVFSPDGRLLAMGNAEDGSHVRLWDLRDPAHPRDVGAALGTTAVTAAFSPDSHVLATAADDDTWRLWDITGHRLRPLTNPVRVATNGVHVLAFSPDGHTLVTGGQSATLFWETDADRAIQRICTAAAPSLTRKQWRQYVGTLHYSPPCP